MTYIINLLRDPVTLSSAYERKISIHLPISIELPLLNYEPLGQTGTLSLLQFDRFVKLKHQ